MQVGKGFTVSEKGKVRKSYVHRSWKKSLERLHFSESCKCVALGKMKSNLYSKKIIGKNI